MDAPKGFVARMKEFFGLMPGQALTDFAKELKMLSYEEKCQFADMLNAAGMPTEQPMKLPGT